MIATNNLTVRFGSQVLFEKVSVLFTPGNCYGIIGANGSGKSTFLKILARDIEPTNGEISLTGSPRISMLRQDQFAFDEVPVLETVLRGHERLFRVLQAKDALYAKEDFSEEDGVKASELEAEFGELGGWTAEAEAAKLLNDLGIPDALHSQLMKQLEASQKVRVLLAQALFGNPDILLLDEPTNQLDLETSLWLEEFLAGFQNTAIVVSHDRHFLNQVCTHIADIDFGKIQIYPGNYDFWRESSELVLRQKSDANKRTEDKRKELQTFIDRFSANASKSRQATSRKKLLEKLTIEDIKPSSRRYPYVRFDQKQEAGNDLLDIEGLTKSVDGQLMFQGLSLHIKKGQKIAFLGANDLIKTTLFRVLAGEETPDSGSFKWGVSTSQAYFPKDNTDFFSQDMTLVDWLRQYSEEKEEQFIRGFLGRMLFSGEEVNKSTTVLSGGEKVRCMLARMMLAQTNVLMLDEPTNHLDLESITALNKGLMQFKGTVLFSSHDHEFIQTIANRIIEITPYGVIDAHHTTLDDYLANPEIKHKRQALAKKQNPAAAKA